MYREKSTYTSKEVQKNFIRWFLWKIDFLNSGFENVAAYNHQKYLLKAEEDLKKPVIYP